MFKKAVLGMTLIASTSAVAHVIPFEHDELVAKLYLQVDMSDCPRIVMQQIGMTYREWLADLDGEVETKEDAIYVARLAHMFDEVFISYQYGPRK